MSARDALYWALWDNYRKAEKNAFIDAFAHELAEEIRGAAGPGLTLGTPYGDGQLFSADLIDPEVTQP